MIKCFSKESVPWETNEALFSNKRLSMHYLSRNNQNAENDRKATFQSVQFPTEVVLCLYIRAIFHRFPWEEWHSSVAIALASGLT